MLRRVVLVALVSGCLASSVSGRVGSSFTRNDAAFSAALEAGVGGGADGTFSVEEVLELGVRIGSDELETAFIPRLGVDVGYSPACASWGHPSIRGGLRVGAVVNGADDALSSVGMVLRLSPAQLRRFDDDLATGNGHGIFEQRPHPSSSFRRLSLVLGVDRLADAGWSWLGDRWAINVGIAGELGVVPGTPRRKPQRASVVAAPPALAPIPRPVVPAAPEIDVQTFVAVAYASEEGVVVGGETTSCRLELAGGPATTRDLGRTLALIEIDLREGTMCSDGGVVRASALRVLDDTPAFPLRLDTIAPSARRTATRALASRGPEIATRLAGLRARELVGILPKPVVTTTDRVEQVVWWTTERKIRFALTREVFEMATPPQQNYQQPSSPLPSWTLRARVHVEVDARGRLTTATFPLEVEVRPRSK